MLLPLLIGLASADLHVPTFVNDPSYTPAPFAGMERLYVDPATTASQLAPKAERPAGQMVKDPAGVRTIVITNPLMQWAEMSVNGTKVGTMGPFATAKLEGFAPGWYSVDLWVTTGLTRKFAVEVK